MLMEWKDNEASRSKEALTVNLVKYNKTIQAMVNTTVQYKTKIKIQ